MTKKEIESSLKQTFTNNTPDIFDAILNDCKEQRGNVACAGRTKRMNRWLYRVAGMVAILLIIACASFGLYYHKINYTLDSTISLDVNPSIEIQVNQKERVLAVIPLNDDGKIVLGDMDLTGSDLEVTVNALIGSMLQNGYLNDTSNSILVSVDSDDSNKSAEIQKRLTDEISLLLCTDTFDGAVLSQTVRQDEDTRALAAQYGITLGKAQLIQQIVSQNSRYTFPDLVPLSINELNLISRTGNIVLQDIESVGAASDKGYVGETAAKSTALSHAGVKEADIFNYSWEMDYDKGKMVYEIEFSSAGYEYDYDIDALTGEVIWNQKEADDDYIKPASGNNNGTGSSTGNSTGSTEDNKGNGSPVISPDSAKSAAFNHAGISAERAKNVRCGLDYENGQQIYEVEFTCDGYEYDYDINASTGAVLQHKVEADDDTKPVQGDSSTGNNGKQPDHSQSKENNDSGRNENNRTDAYDKPADYDDDEIDDKDDDRDDDDTDDEDIDDDNENDDDDDDEADDD